MTKNDDWHGDLHDYHAGSYLRAATQEERDASQAAAAMDGGAGVILIDRAGDILRADEAGASEAQRCYVVY